MQNTGHNGWGKDVQDKGMGFPHRAGLKSPGTQGNGQDGRKEGTMVPRKVKEGTWVQKNSQSQAQIRRRGRDGEVELNSSHLE